MSKKTPLFLRHRWLPVAIGCAITAFDVWWFAVMPFSWFRLFNIFAFWMGVTASWYYSHRQPFGWICFQLGTRVDVSDSSQVAELTDEEADAEITEWLAGSGIKRFTKTDIFSYFFLWKKDAVQFKLAWG